MDKLLVLGTTPTSIELIEKAKARGVYTIVTDFLEPEKSPAKLVSDEYWMISTHELDLLEEKCKEEGITAVIAGISENNLRFMAQLCQRLGLPCWCTPESWNAIQTKDEFKKLCREHGVPVAKDYFLSNPPLEEELNEILFPVVVKPVDLNSTNGVSFCNTKEEVINACKYARSLSKVDTLIVEEMLTGDFSMAHCVLADGSAVLLTVNVSVLAEDNGFTYVTISSEHLKHMYKNQVMPAIQKLLNAANCREGVCTVQSFLNKENQFHAIEMGYRNSGDQMLYAHREAFGFDSLSWLLDVSLGIQHNAEDLPYISQEGPEKHACKYTIFSNAAGTIQKIEGLDVFQQIPGILTWVDAFEGRTVTNHSPLVRATFAATTENQIREIIEKINASVRIYDEHGNNLMLYFNNFEGIHNMLNK